MSSFDHARYMRIAASRIAHGWIVYVRETAAYREYWAVRDGKRDLLAREERTFFEEPVIAS